MKSWWCLASSANGTTLIAGSAGTNAGLYISTNSGMTWISNNVPNNATYGTIRALACSADGRKLIVAPGTPALYTSTDLGNTWTLRLADQCWSVASSSAGTRLLASNPSRGIYASTNSGSTWATNAMPGVIPYNLAMSADGEKAFAAAHGGRIFRSTNSGLSWVQTDAPSLYWREVTCSGDGTQVAAVGWNTNASGSFGVFYLSSDSGATWRAANVPSYYWRSVASSFDGRRWLAGFQSAGGARHFYISGDSGNTWMPLEMPQNAARNWDDPVLAASSDGEKFVAAMSSIVGPNPPLDAPIAIYNWPLPPRPGITIGFTNAFFKYLPFDQRRLPGVVLTWPSSATNFTLQQSLGLGGGWVTVTNAPVLVVDPVTQMNSYRVVLPLLDSQGFYRLWSP